MEQRLAVPMLAALAATALTIGPAPVRGARRDSPADTTLTHEHPGDTVVVSGPTIVAAFPITQQHVDSDADANEALADFQYYLPRVRDSLRALNGTLVVRYDSLIPIREGSARWVWRVAADSGGVGYLLLAPRRPARTIWGVMTDADLLEAFGRFLSGG